MKHLLHFLLFFVIASVSEIHAQIQDVVVELYYVSDLDDATDTIGGGLAVGSKTYRIYVDLDSGYQLKKVYGDANHRLLFSSSNPFFNHKEESLTFGKDFTRNRLKENTVALDTWITIGQLTKSSAITYFGLPKADDTTGSVIGGSNNDGGSAEIVGGLLKNDDPAAGIPLTISDGNDTMSELPINWAHYGFLSGSGDDSTIFGNITTDTLFESRNAALQHSGVQGINRSKNMVLVAQLTTTGDITFELNLELSLGNGNPLKFVASGDILLPGETVFPKLKYPPSCGCTNPDFLEYSPNYSCPFPDSCKTPIVLGCTDPAACNYNELANINLPSLCCYIGACNDLDISLVCPTLSLSDELEEHIQVFPNPVENDLTIRVGNTSGVWPIFIKLFDPLGKQVKSSFIENTSTASFLDMRDVAEGMYWVELQFGGQVFRQRVIKN